MTDLRKPIRLFRAYDISIDAMRWGILKEEEEWPAGIDSRLELSQAFLTELLKLKEGK